MFGSFGKKKISPSQAVESYIVGMTKVAEEHYDEWMEMLMKVTTLSDVSSDEIVEIISDKDTKLIYLTALIAVDAQAIQNCFDVHTAAKLYNALDHTLTAAMGEETSPLSELVFDYLDRQKIAFDEMEFWAEHNMALRVLENLGFDKHEKTKAFFERPSVVYVLSAHIIETALGYWKLVSDNYVVKE